MGLKLLLVSDGGDHLGELELEGSTATLKKLSPDFKASIEDAYEEDDHDDGIEPDEMEKDVDPEGKMSDAFAMRKHEESESKEEEKEEHEEEPEDDDDDDKPMFSRKPMKQKRKGLF